MQLTELNKELYKVFEGVRDGKIEVAQARALVGVSHAINENCRLQLDTAKEIGGKVFLGYMGDEVTQEPKVITVSSQSVKVSPELSSTEKTTIEAPPVSVKQSSGDAYYEKTAFAKSLGFSDIVDAIGAHGARGFNNMFKERKS